MDDNGRWGRTKPFIQQHVITDMVMVMVMVVVWKRGPTWAINGELDFPRPVRARGLNQ